MPTKGFTSITVKEKVKNQLTEIAAKEDLTVPHYLEHLAKKLSQQESD